MLLDFSAVPRMPDGRTGAEHIAAIEALAERRVTPMGNGGNMVWHIWGERSGRPALLLFHGGSGSWIHWIRNVVPLARHFTVYAADLPGLGDSDPPDDVHDIWSVVHCVKRGIEAILPADVPYDIAGFSFGGMVGGHVSTLLDNRLRSVTLVGPGGLRLPREPRPPLVRLRRQTSAEALTEGGRRNLEILMLHDPAAVDGVAIHMQILNSTRAKTRSADMSAKGVLSDCLPRIKTRLNAIWGEFDSTAYPHLHLREALLRQHQPDIDFRIIPGGGHWVAFEKADAFNAALIDLLG
jgi:2-hydroxy-6-oxonona-2,4-dienedioate hydrolase